MESTRDLYLDLIKKTLINWIYGDCEEAACEVPSALAELVAATYGERAVRLVQPKPFDPAFRTEGKDWPPQAHTMVGLLRLNNLQECVQTALDENIPGDFIETGVWRGGSTILMRAILKANGITNRTVWVADSFQGLPRPDAELYPADKDDILYSYPALAVSLDRVRENFNRYGLLDDQVQFLKGWFKDTLPDAPPAPLAVVRLDGDMYESTMDGLNNLYPRLSPGGFLIVDDYGCIPACKQAIHDYRDKHGIHENIHTVDWTGVYWRKDR